MKRKSASTDREIDEKPPLERREFERVELPATAFALNEQGDELGRVVEIGGGGLLLNPASPSARLSLTKGQRLTITVVEPTTGNRTEMAVEVRHIKSKRIGLRFL